MSSNNIISFFSKRKWILFSLFIVTPAGFLCKRYAGPGHVWFTDYGGGVLYEVFWCLVVFFLIPSKKHIMPIAVSVLIITSILETLQLWHPWFLEQLRLTYWGRVFLGTTFVWWDFPYYVLGCFVGWLCMRAISRRFD